MVAIFFSSDDDDTLITQPDDVALNVFNGLCEIFSQMSQSDEQKIVMTTACLLQ